MQLLGFEESDENIVIMWVIVDNIDKDPRTIQMVILQLMFKQNLNLKKVMMQIPRGYQFNTQGALEVVLTICQTVWQNYPNRCHIYEALARY